MYNYFKKEGVFVALHLEEYFLPKKIEYFAALSYRDCKVSAQNIMDRENFTPKSVIIYLLPYYTGECKNLSRYAASLDYHLLLKDVNAGLSSFLKDNFPNAKMRGYGDHSPIDERYAALISGLGISGRNGLLINEKYGSYVFIGDVITDIEPEELGALPMHSIRSCLGCDACKRACPTSILSGEGTSCLSEITQRKGTLSDSEAALMRKYNTLWGCDVCQSVCPHNKDVPKTPIDFFYNERITYLTREVLDGMDDEQFSRRAFSWRKRKTVERNLDILFGENQENDN